jgi:hypothetical protein
VTDLAAATAAATSAVSQVAGLVTELASAVTALDDHRARAEQLRDAADALRLTDVIVVDCELAVLDAVDRQLDTARSVLDRLRSDPTDESAFDGLRAVVAAGAWSALDEVEAALRAKDELYRQATADVQARLGPWVDVESAITDMNEELRRRNAVLHREVAQGRDRLLTLVNKAKDGLASGQLLQAMGCLDALDEPSVPATRPSDPVPVPAQELRARLADELDSARQYAGRVQLTVLRGPLDRDRFEYTLMLLTPGGDRHVGVNVQDTTTIVVQDRKYFLEVVDRAGGTAYRSLRSNLSLPLGPARDAKPPTGQAPTEPAARLTELQEMGAILYKLLLPDRMKEELAQHPLAQLTITTNDLELPWELMYTGEPGRSGNFLALERPVCRMPVGRSRGRQSGEIEDRPRIRRVALIASVGQPKLTDARREVEQIRDRLKETWKDQVEVDLLITDTDAAPSGAQFRRMLLAGSFDIVHYAGHAAFDAGRPDQSGLLLDDGEVCFAQKIQRLLQGHPLVFLNACETARLTEPDERRPPEGTYEGDPREGLASAFVYGGALACIGAMWPVSDVVAADFAVSFYGQVLEGQPLGRAMLKARAHTSETFQDDPSWAAFVLYGDPAFQLAPVARPMT